jgi:hypothetical protein
MTSEKENLEKNKEQQDVKPSIVTEVTEDDWKDFFETQEDFNFIFDR